MICATTGKSAGGVSPDAVLQLVCPTLQPSSQMLEPATPTATTGDGRVTTVMTRTDFATPVQQNAGTGNGHCYHRPQLCFYGHGENSFCYNRPTKMLEPPTAAATIVSLKPASSVLKPGSGHCYNRRWRPGKVEAATSGRKRCMAMLQAAYGASAAADASSDRRRELQPTSASREGTSASSGGQGCEASAVSGRWLPSPEPRTGAESGLTNLLLVC